ncbi:MAG: hypothetical protein IJD10_02975, partial [Clostridia bacterium]|nr:hypothetical protein [Clostridia bacterium]
VFPLARMVAENESYLQRFTEVAIVCHHLALEDQGKIRIHFHPQKRAFTLLLTLKAISVPHQRFHDLAPLRYLSSIKLLGISDEIYIQMVCPLFDFPPEYSFFNFDEDFGLSPDE